MLQRGESPEVSRGLFNSRCPYPGKKIAIEPVLGAVTDQADRQVSAAIVEACRAGDRDAFRALYDQHKDKVYSIALYFFHGDAEAWPATSPNRYS